MTRISDWLIDPADSAEQTVERLRTIAEALMRNAEERRDPGSAAFEEFRRAALLEDRVRQRTRDLEATLERLNEVSGSAERARRDLAQAIEAIDEGFALFDAQERLVLFNSRFCAGLPDVRALLEPGMQFRSYVDIVSRSPHVILPEAMAPGTWVGQRTRLHAQGQDFNLELSGDRWLQIGERRTADGGTVLLHTDVSRIIRTERSEHD